MSPEQTSRKVLCVLSEEQRQEYRAELEQLQQAGVAFELTDEPDQALDQIGDLEPCMVMVGMELGEMEGLEFVALMMNRYKSYEGKVLVLPAKDDPFPPVLQQRNTATGKSSTDQIDASQIPAVVREAALGSAAPLPPAPAAGPATPALAPPAASELPEALPAPPAGPGTPPPEPPPILAAQAPAGLAPIRESAPASRGRPAWLLPAGAVAVVALAAIIYVATRGGGDEEPTTEPGAARAKTTDTSGASAKPPGAESSADPGAQPGDDTAGDDTAGDDTAGDDTAGDDTETAKSTKPGQASHPELRAYATLPLEFPRGGYSFTVSDQAALKAAVAPFANVLEEDPAVWLEIGGHTSIDGAPEANYDLGKRRANKVRGLLGKHGIPKARTIVKNYGAAMPAASNDTHEGRAQNRRVTIRLVD